MLPVDAPYYLVPVLVNEWLPVGLPPDRIRQALQAGYTPGEAAGLTEDEWLAVRILAGLRDTPAP